MSERRKEVTMGVGRLSILWVTVREWLEGEGGTQADVDTADVPQADTASVELRILNLLRDKDDVTMIQSLLDRLMDEDTSGIAVLTAIQGLLTRGTIAFTADRELHRL